jgi:hypothetical protein
MGDEGLMEVELCLLRSRSADVKVGASGNFERGSSSVRASALVAATCCKRATRGRRTSTGTGSSAPQER